MSRQAGTDSCGGRTAGESRTGMGTCGAMVCDAGGRCGRRGAWPLFLMAAALMLLGLTGGSRGWLWLGAITAASAVFWEVLARRARHAGRENGGC